MSKGVGNCWISKENKKHSELQSAWGRAEDLTQTWDTCSCQTRSMSVLHPSSGHCKGSFLTALFLGNQIPVTHSIPHCKRTLTRAAQRPLPSRGNAPSLSLYEMSQKGNIALSPATGGGTEPGWVCSKGYVCCCKPFHFCKSTSQDCETATSGLAKAFLLEEKCAATRISLKSADAWQTLSYCHLQNERTAAQQFVCLYWRPEAVASWRDHGSYTPLLKYVLALRIGPSSSRSGKSGLDSYLGTPGPAAALVPCASLFQGLLHETSCAPRMASEHELSRWALLQSPKYQDLKPYHE